MVQFLRTCEISTDCFGGGGCCVWFWVLLVVCLFVLVLFLRSLCRVKILVSPL